MVAFAANPSVQSSKKCPKVQMAAHLITRLDAVKAIRVN